MNTSANHIETGCCAESHDHNSRGAHIHPVVKNLKIAFFLNATFTVVEFIGGVLTNSVAILSDAVHDLGDTFAIGASLFFERYSTKARDRKYSYGYKRFSPLAAMINSIILFAGSAIIIYESAPRLLAPEAVHVEGMLLLAVLGVAMNGAAVLRLKKSGDSLNQRAVMLHLMEDALGWIAVLIGGVVMLIWNVPIIDPVLSLAIAAYILWNAVKNLKPVFRIFLQAVPQNIDELALKKKLKKLPHVKDVHDVHVWSLDGDYHILTLHLIVPDDLSRNAMIQAKKDAMKIVARQNVRHYTIELEFESEKCAFENC